MFPRISNTRFQGVISQSHDLALTVCQDLPRLDWLFRNEINYSPYGELDVTSLSKWNIPLPWGPVRSNNSGNSGLLSKNWSVRPASTKTKYYYSSSRPFSFQVQLRFLVQSIKVLLNSRWFSKCFENFNEKKLGKMFWIIENKKKLDLGVHSSYWKLKYEGMNY